ncbi:hypothetical protein NEF87_002765 [Candidatus Lokiarchaeum ossiferum]|uniref:Uncharacterized protein n=1 Tax=Candidatus Lokiarchaeum ossiferum TaxID=2951803 RepID=A0ABY6HSJ8_9ARCH|nr:hypothetical protein NEF87_002765 [Candidatus Lokiarchaeum sp. B-35]
MEKKFGEVFGKYRITDKEFWFKTNEKEYRFPVKDVRIEIQRPKYSGPFYFVQYNDKSIDLEDLRTYCSEINKSLLKYHVFMKKKKYIRIIKELVSELKEGDEVKLEEALSVVKEEYKILHAKEIRGVSKKVWSKHPQRTILIPDSFLENFFRLIGEHISGFEFVRLKKTIRMKSDISTSLDQIDVLFADWDSNPQKYKKRTLVD